ncbi:MAG: hypothetical protein ACM3VZ_05495 [Acidobacteriota bacterium]
MDKRHRDGHRSTDPVGGGHAWRPSLGYLVVAVVLVAGGITYGWMTMSSSSDSDPVAATPASPSASGGASAWPIQATVPTSAVVTPPPPEAPRAPERDADPTPDLSNYVARGEKPTMNEVIDRLHQAGIHTGLGAFNPPGTRPPLVGLAVPEGFALPDGYVRHYQATDDGQRIEPILMYAPDRQFFDASNKPIEIPKDRVVPPELAPPGLPIRKIVIPAPTESGRAGL